MNNDLIVSDSENAEEIVETYEDYLKSINVEKYEKELKKKDDEEIILDDYIASIKFKYTLTAVKSLEDLFHDKKDWNLEIMDNKIKSLQNSVDITITKGFKGENALINAKDEASILVNELEKKFCNINAQINIIDLNELKKASNKDVLYNEEKEGCLCINFCCKNDGEKCCNIS